MSKEIPKAPLTPLSLTGSQLGPARMWWHFLLVFLPSFIHFPRPLPLPLPEEWCSYSSFSPSGKRSSWIAVFQLLLQGNCWGILCVFLPEVQSVTCTANISHVRFLHHFPDLPGWNPSENGRICGFMRKAECQSTLGLPPIIAKSIPSWNFYTHGYKTAEKLLLWTKTQSLSETKN